MIKSTYLDGNDDNQRPEDQRQHAKHVRRVERQPVLGVEALTECINWACPDIAEDDTERSDAQPGKPGGCIRPVFPNFVFCGRRGVPGGDDRGSRWVGGRVLHAVLLSAAKGHLVSPEKTLPEAVPLEEAGLSTKR